VQVTAMFDSSSLIEQFRQVQFQPIVRLERLEMRPDEVLSVPKLLSVTSVLPVTSHKPR
jgi:hypothetical protein